MASKAKPKKITLQVLETGQRLNFLCKQERKGDLRKHDAALQATVVAVAVLYTCSTAYAVQSLLLLQEMLIRCSTTAATYDAAAAADTAAAAAAAVTLDHRMHD
eukprot:11053-Heterococcus_DN1.PRE.3